MAKRLNFEASISEVLKKFVETNNLTKGLNKVQVKDAWFDIMGPGIKSYTQEVVLNNNTLIVTLSSSIVKQELSFGKEKIRTMLNEALGENIIKDIILR